jgi:hypothetical protein
VRELEGPGAPEWAVASAVRVLAQGRENSGPALSGVAAKVAEAQVAPGPKPAPAAARFRWSRRPLALGCCVRLRYSLVSRV